MKVLVVDDDQRLREALEIDLQLHWQDAHIFTVADGEEGLEVFFNEEPDIVLLDVTMPRMNSFEVLKAIRQVSDVPVLMLTARDEDVDQVRGLELGADDYIGKPFSHLALIARIKVPTVERSCRRLSRRYPTSRRVTWRSIFRIKKLQTR